MTGNLKKEIKMQNIEIKEEIQEEIPPSSTVEDTFTVYMQEEGIKNESQVILEEEVKIKEDNVCIQEEVSPVLTLEDTCTVYVQGEVKTENIEIKGDVLIF